MRIVIGAGGEEYSVSPAVEQYLRSLDASALSDLVLELASYSDGAMRSLELRAAPDAAPVLRLLTADIDAALAGIDLDYHDPFYVDPYGDAPDDGVQAVEDVIDELERHLDAGAREGVQAALQHLLTRLGDIGHEADNGEVLVGVAERACDLFGRAVEGHPDPAGLARWMVGFRQKYEGWPSLTADTVAAALDAHGWAAYRASVNALGGGGQPADPYRNEVACMLLELADHDGDVDHAVFLLSGGALPYYGEIVRRLGAAGRHAEVLDWLDRAVAQDKVDLVPRADRAIVDAVGATSTYLTAGRRDEALTLSRALFERDVTVGAYQLLCEVARRCGCLPEQRDWALRKASEQAANTDGAFLIRLHLADGDTAEAWEAADAFGAGGAWTQLVEASEDVLPLKAAGLCLAQARDRLTTPDSSQYRGVVALLVKARSLCDKAGHRSEADIAIAHLRQTYRRRPALMAEMDRAGLPA